MNTTKLRQPYFLYLLAISFTGLAFVALGLSQIPTMTPKSYLLLIVALAIFAEVSATSVTISKQEITFEVGTAVSMALIPLFGAGVAAVSVAIACSLGIWAIQYSNKTPWKRNWEQISFNAGMHSTAIFIAGVIFLKLQQLLGANTLLGQVVPWIVAAVLYDQLNFWMLMIIIRLKQGPTIHPVTIWQENLWAVPINIIILSVGGGVLALAVNQVGLVGILVFFLPIVLSAYAFRMYVRQMQEHMNNLEHIVAERTDALQKLMREKDSFLAVLTHDMKSPLTSINLYATIIRDYPDMLKEKPHMTEVILRSQETLTAIVDNILDLEKLKESGQLLLKKEDFDLGTLLEKVVKLLRPQAESKHIGLHLDSFELPISVSADKSQIERALHNLISNAIKYTPNEGKIDISLDAKGEQVRIRVQDSGYGIPADELPYIFDRFRRVESNKSMAAGSGLGLAITKALIEAHDGEIKVTSEIDSGSVFTAYLPIRIHFQSFHSNEKIRNNPRTNPAINSQIITVV
ncbi:MAG: hypothetical protein GY805_18905 [Chloroflexi bacterium]|nr:hypothetical protein [Chloroflexota bacterium]